MTPRRSDIFSLSPAYTTIAACLGQCALPTLRSGSLQVSAWLNRFFVVSNIRKIVVNQLIARRSDLRENGFMRAPRNYNYHSFSQFNSTVTSPSQNKRSSISIGIRLDKFLCARILAIFSADRIKEFGTKTNGTIKIRSRTDVNGNCAAKSTGCASKRTLPKQLKLNKRTIKRKVGNLGINYERARNSIHFANFQNSWNFPAALSANSIEEFKRRRNEATKKSVPSQYQCADGVHEGLGKSGGRSFILSCPTRA